MSDERNRLTEEMARTTFQRKVVSRQSPADVLDSAIEFFGARGYRTGRSGRPNQAYVIGGREGGLPRVTAEILVQTTGRSAATMVTISGFGESLAQHLKDFAGLLRKPPSPTPEPPHD